jgi:hypothetical protein
MPISMESSFFFSCLLINIGQLYSFNVYVCSDIAFQPAHCIVSLKKTFTSLSSSVLRETFKVNLLLISYL